MKFQTFKITCVADLLVRLPQLHKGTGSIWFRGHSDHQWHLEPSLSRKGKLGNELQLIKQFKQNAHQFLDHTPLGEADWIFLMQHYGVPTRLLDWTENPLVALYFALLDEQSISRKRKRKVAAAVWCLYPKKLNEISGLILNPPDDIPAFGDDQELEDYLPSRVHAQGITRKSPVAITAARKFSRVYAQAGVFTILHREGIRIDELEDKKGRQDHLVKLLIPRGAIPRLRKEIRFLGIHKLSIFPQLENVAEKSIAGDVMKEFECNQKTDSTVMMMYLDRAKIFLNPPYQRASGIWNLEKKQLLIDSLINSFDIPKIYLHEYQSPQKHGGQIFTYAIVDGKQRLQTIWDFMDGEFALSDDIEFLKDPGIKLRGLKYDDLSREHSTIHARFTGRLLSIITIRTSDTELIEDMFSRLNEAVPLNAAEKRNAFGGPVPIAIRKLAKNKFFTDRVRISSARYRHFDLACKLLLIESENKAVDTKKSALDAFVKHYAKSNLRRKTEQLASSTEKVLVEMNDFFKTSDHLLRSPGIVVVYYLLFREIIGNGASKSAVGLTRRNLLAFEEKLDENRKVAEEDTGKPNFEYLEFDRLSQSPNDASAIEYRLKVLRKFLRKLAK